MLRRVNDYIASQILLEENYYNQLHEQYGILIGLLSEAFTNGRDKQEIIYQSQTWARFHTDSVRSVNFHMAQDIHKFVDANIIPAPEVGTWLPREVSHIVKDLTSNTDNLTNTIIGIFLLAIPIGISQTEDSYREAALDELIHRCNNAIKRTVQDGVSQSVASMVIDNATALGYTEYLPDNQHDDKVRELHKKQNPGDKWYPINKPPSSGYPGTQWGCRCTFKGFR